MALLFDNYKKLVGNILAFTFVNPNNVKWNFRICNGSRKEATPWHWRELQGCILQNRVSAIVNPLTRNTIETWIHFIVCMDTFNDFPSEIEIHHMICLNSKHKQKEIIELTPEELVYCICKTNYHSPLWTKNGENNEQVILSIAKQIPCHMLNPFLWDIDDHQIAYNIINTISY